MRTSGEAGELDTVCAVRAVVALLGVVRPGKVGTLPRTVDIDAKETLGLRSRSRTEAPLSAGVLTGTFAFLDSEGSAASGLGNVRGGNVRLRPRG